MVSIDAVATGLRIAELRDTAGLTNNDIVDALGFTTRNAIYKWFSGKSLPTIDNLVLLADLFNVTIDGIVVTKRS